MIRVSVVMCTYNGSRYVVEQVRSIVQQSHHVSQLVVADDGSQDGTLELVREAVSGYPSVELLVLEPKGQPLGVNQNFARALSAADGDFVALADQDDVWLHDRVEVAVARLRSDPDVQLVASDSYLIDAYGVRFGRLFDQLGVRDRDLNALSSSHPMHFLVRKSVLPGMSMMIRRSLLDAATPVPPNWPHDYWLSIVAGAIGRLEVVRRPLVEYRQHGSNVIGAGDGSTLAKLRRLMEQPSDARRLEGLFNHAELWLASQDGIAPSTSDSIRGKARFERERAELPKSVALRALRALWLSARADGYSKYSSNGRLHVARDFLRAP